MESIVELVSVIRRSAGCCRTAFFGTGGRHALERPLRRPLERPSRDLLRKRLVYGKSLKENGRDLAGRLAVLLAAA